MPFGVITSPYLLAATTRHHLSKIGSPLASAILRNIYVDNAFISANTLDEAKQFYRESIELFTTARMNLREHISNDRKLNLHIQTVEKRDVENHSKLLGIPWNTVTDYISIVLPRYDPSITEGCWTKRKILKIVASIYDPIRFLAPMTTSFKIFLQSLRTVKLGTQLYLITTRRSGSAFKKPFSFRHAIYQDLCSNLPVTPLTQFTYSQMLPKEPMAL